MLHLSSNQTLWIIGINFWFGLIMTIAIDKLPTIIFAETLSDVVAHLLSPPRCTMCDNYLRPHHMIPILSFLYLNYRCHYCKDIINKKYIVTEIMAIIIGALCCFGSASTEVALYHMFIINCLWMISCIDFEHQIIPDTLSLGGLWLIIIWNISIYNHGLKTSIAGMCMAYLILSSFSWIYRQARSKPGMGGGDIKLFALIGAWLGPSSLLATLFIASSLALICSFIHLRSRWHPQIALPFGPYLAFAGVVLHSLNILRPS